MAKQFRKLQQKIHPKPTPKPKEKVGKDYLLIAVIAFTSVVLVAGWGYLDLMNRAMYLLLILSLTLNYARRHAKLSETQHLLADRISLVSIGLAVALFVIILVQNYIL